MDAVWVGWCWDATLGEWLSICTDRDLRACHRALIAWCEAQGVPMKWAMLTQGAKPMRYRW